VPGTYTPPRAPLPTPPRIPAGLGIKEEQQAPIDGWDLMKK
jgi:hypothetical protein